MTGDDVRPTAYDRWLAAAQAEVDAQVQVDELTVRRRVKAFLEHYRGLTAEQLAQIDVELGDLVPDLVVHGEERAPTRAQRLRLLPGHDVSPTEPS